MIFLTHLESWSSRIATAGLDVGHELGPSRNFLWVRYDRFTQRRYMSYILRHTGRSFATELRESFHDGKAAVIFFVRGEVCILRKRQVEQVH